MRTSARTGAPLVGPRLMLCAAVTLFTVATLAWSGPASRAQVTVSADVVAARVRTFYEQTRTVQARFEQHFWRRVYQRTESSSGRLLISRPGRIRFNYERPRGNVLVSDGNEWTLYEAEANQYVRGSTAAASASALGFLTGTADFRDYRRSLRPPSSSQPPQTDALELRPRREDPHYRRIVLYVGNQTDTLGAVLRVSVEDPDGNWNRFDFIEPQFNRALDAGVFSFSPPDGARQITAPGS